MVMASAAAVASSSREELDNCTHSNSDECSGQHLSSSSFCKHAWHFSQGRGFYRTASASHQIPITRVQESPRLRLCLLWDMQFCARAPMLHEQSLYMCSHGHRDKAVDAPGTKGMRTSMPVRSVTTVWKLSRDSRRPWAISAW